MSARCMLHAHVFCFTRFHQVLGWSSCLALSNQQACVRPCCFTGRPRPLGTGFFNGSMVLSIDLLLPPLRFLFFLSDGCMAQRSRCPGGRPSVSANKRIHNAYYSVIKVATVQAKYKHRIRPAVSQRVPLSVLASPIASSN